MGEIAPYVSVRDRTVVKANDLIQRSRFSLTTQQQKIVLYLITKIEYNDDEFKLYEFRIQDFCQVCGIDIQGGKTYDELKSTIQQIADKSVWIRLQDGRETLIRWIERPYIDEGSGIIQIKLDELMKPYLLQLKQNFTQYELIYTLAMKSKYSIRLYELVKSIHFNELETYTRRYKLAELQQLLDAEKYNEYRDFNRRVLKPAIAEIAAYTDKLVSYVPLKRGQKVVAIDLTISTKDVVDRTNTRRAVEDKLGLLQLSFWDDML